MENQGGNSSPGGYRGWPVDAASNQDLLSDPKLSFLNQSNLEILDLRATAGTSYPLNTSSNGNASTLPLGIYPDFEQPTTLDHTNRQPEYSQLPPESGNSNASVWQMAKEIKKFRCKECQEQSGEDKRFRTDHDLQRHRAEIHEIAEGGRQLTRLFCDRPDCKRSRQRGGKPFKRRSNLDQHMQTMHQGDSVEQSNASDPAESNVPTLHQSITVARAPRQKPGRRTRSGSPARSTPKRRSEAARHTNHNLEHTRDAESTSASASASFVSHGSIAKRTRLQTSHSASTEPESEDEIAKLQRKLSDLADERAEVRQKRKGLEEEEEETRKALNRKRQKLEEADKNIELRHKRYQNRLYALLPPRQQWRTSEKG